MRTVTELISVYIIDELEILDIDIVDHVFRIRILIQFLADAFIEEFLCKKIREAVVRRVISFLLQEPLLSRDIPDRQKSTRNPAFLISGGSSRLEVVLCFRTVADHLIA